MAREELKINIVIKGEQILVGAQATDCDPKMTMLKGDLKTALERIPSFVEESNKEWDWRPRNPKSTIPEPKPPVPAKTAVASKPATSNAGKGSSETAPPKQTPFF
jgi:hypothetical protein